MFFIVAIAMRGLYARSRDRTHRGKVIPVGLEQRRELGDDVPLIVDDARLLARPLSVVVPIAIVTACVLGSKP